MRKPKIALKTEDGMWIVKAQRMTYLFNSLDEAIRFVEVCYKGVR